MPITRSAFVGGHLSEPRVRMLTDACDTDPAAFGRDEAMLVSQARSLDAHSFPKAVAYWQRLADHEGHLRQAGLAFQRRRLHVSATWNGTVTSTPRVAPWSSPPSDHSPTRPSPATSTIDHRRSGGPTPSSSCAATTWIRPTRRWG